jgi:hypothetical protein
MCGPEEWPSRGSNPADKIRLTGPAAKKYKTLTMLLEKKIWWQEANSVRIPLGITLAIAWAFRLRAIYINVKNAPQRSPRVRRIEAIIATVLWTFIAVGVALLLIFAR